MPSHPILKPGPPPASKSDAPPVPFAGIVTDPLESQTIGLGLGHLALSQNLRSSGGSLQARLGGVPLIVALPSGCTSYIDHKDVILSGTTYVAAGFGDSTNTRLYITSNFSAWTEITELTGQDGLTRFAGIATNLSWSVIKSPRSFMNIFNGTPRDVLVISDGSTVRLYDPGGSATNFCWQHATPIFPTGAESFSQLATFENSVSVAGATRTYTAPSGVINASRYKFSDSAVAPYNVSKVILLTMTSSALVGDQAQMTLAASFTPDKMLIMVVEADTPSAFQDWISNTSIQISSGTASVALTSATAGSPVSIISATAHGKLTGDSVTITGNVLANGTWIFTKTGATTGTLNGSSTIVADVAGGRISFVSSGHTFFKTINLATATSPIGINWTTTSPAIPTGVPVTVYGNALANGTYTGVTLGSVTPPTSNLTLNGSSTPAGTIAGGQIVNATTIYDPTSTDAKITTPLFFTQIGENEQVAVQYLVAFDLTSVSPGAFSLLQFTRLANAPFSANLKILNLATNGKWAGSTGFGIAYERSNAFAESPGFVAAVEGTDVLSGFGGPSNVTNSGTVVTLDVGGDTLLQATSGSATTAVVSTAPFTASAFIGKYLSILYGTGAGQAPAKISANTTTTITFATLATAPDNTSVFFVSDSSSISRGAPQLPIPTSALSYDYDFTIVNPWVQPNVATPGFAGGLAGVPDSVAIYVTPAGSRDNGQPGTYQYLCSTAFVSPTSNYQSLGPGWTYNFSATPAVIKTTERELSGLDRTNLNNLRLLPTPSNQAIPANSFMFTALGRLFIAQPVQDLLIRSGEGWFSQDKFNTRFQETFLDREGLVDESLGGSAKFNSGQVGETLQCFVGNSAEEGISSVYALTGHAFYRMGNPATNSTSQASSSLSTPTPLAGHGTNAPDSAVECLGVVYWLDQYGHFVRYTPSYQNQFQFQSGIEDLSSRRVGDRFRDLPAGRLAQVSVTSVGHLIYVAYTPAGGTLNTHCLIYDAQYGFWAADDLLPATWDAARFRRLFDPTVAGSGQRIMGMTASGKLFEYEASTSSDFGTGIVACRVTTGAHCPGMAFTFGQARFMGQSETGLVTVTRTNLETGETWISTIPLTDPRNPANTLINGLDSLGSAWARSGTSQAPIFRGTVDFQWSYTPGRKVDGLFIDTLIQESEQVGIR